MPTHRIPIVGADGRINLSWYKYFESLNRTPFVLRGNWDANTNAPTLANGVGNDGVVYIVTTAGATVIDGFGPWAVGDWIYFANGQWNKLTA